jgi:hypothetical protein
VCLLSFECFPFLKMIRECCFFNIKIIQSFAKRNREQYLKSQYFSVIMDFYWAVSFILDKWSAIWTLFTSDTCFRPSYWCETCVNNQPCSQVLSVWNWSMIKFIRTFIFSGVQKTVHTSEANSTAQEIVPQLSLSILLTSHKWRPRAHQGNWQPQFP